MIAVVACEVMKEELKRVRVERPVAFHFVSMGLHRWPEKLSAELSRLLVETSGVERVVLGFGLCGGAAAGLAAPGVPLTIPRSHDCIPLLVGSRQTHEELQEEERGTFYLSGGWLEGERTVITEYRRVRDKFGEKKAQRVMATMFDAYRRLLFIHTGHPREEEHLAAVRELAELLGLSFAERDGGSAWLERLVNGPWDDDRFVTIQPGELLDQAAFGGAAAGMQNL